MKDYTYKEQELEYIRHMKSTSPKKIWWGFVKYVFDYGDFYYQLRCSSEIADSQNKADEAIIGEFTKHEEPFIPTEHDKLVCENKKIEDLYIVRAFLYFTTSRKFSKFEKIARRIKQRIKVILTGKKDPWGDTLSETISFNEEITCHPQSEEAKKADPRYSNLIDVGLLIQIDGKCLKTFIESNGYGFHIWDEKYFFEPQELKSSARAHEFIKV
jgi:hypothetical protein